MKTLKGILFCALLFNIFISCTTTQKTTQSVTETIPEKQVDTTSENTILPEEPKVQPKYRAEEKKLFDLVHTKLEVSFNWPNRQLNGIATVQLKPHFYPQSTLILDAKGFDIHNIEKLDGDQVTELEYEYDGMILSIDLQDTVKRSEVLTVKIDYTANPYDIQVQGSDAILEDRGLYFINHDGKDESKPQQIWTQGETEASSCWFPTIDAPNQRTTQEMYITVEDRFKTLSNGELIYSQINKDNTRTDYWKMDQSHAPYLFMMAIGEFAVVEDEWNDLSVDYYVEPEYEPYAKDIFGNTPEMMTLFSDLLDYPYPWNKYSQVVVRDYVSGAMENTTASLYMEELQMNSRELLDDNYDDIIAHELIHQWFGDLVTCESWSNLTLNEGFASYGEYLWIEHSQSKADAEYKLHEELTTYLNEAETKKVDLIRFYYDNRESMFDSHSYSKGGLILHMLRDYLGDEAFFGSLNHYLQKNKFQDVEVHDLRLAFETVTGEDLNWFFNQWFLDDGHPVLEVKHHYVDSTQSFHISVNQNQNFTDYPLYQIPVDIEIWSNGSAEEKVLWVRNEENDFTFEVANKPDLFVFNSNEDIVAEVSHDKSIEEWRFQAQNASNVVSRLRAYGKIFEDSSASTISVFEDALNADFYEIKRVALEYATNQGDSLIKSWEDKIVQLAKGDAKSEVKSDAHFVLLENFGDKYEDLFREAMNDSSYLVAGSGLFAMLQLPVSNKEELVERFEDEENINFVLPLANYFIGSRDSTKLDWFEHQINAGGTETQYYLIRMLGQYMMPMSEEKIKRGIDIVADFAMNSPKYYLRIAAIQSLQLYEEIPYANLKLQAIKNKEEDARVRGFLE